MKAPELSVLVISFNTRNLTLSCIEGFYDDATAAGWEVIVVDNGSSDGTADAVADRFPAARVVRSQRNLGYAGGSNLGLRMARGEVIVLLNSDVFVPPQVLLALARVLRENPDIGALSPGLRTAAGEPQPFAFGQDPTLGYLLRRGWRALRRKGPLHDWGITQPTEVDWVSGACLATRREVLERVGLLDERFFLYFEDNDWCLRVRRAGWRVVYDPRWQVTHLGGASQPDRWAVSRVYRQSLLAFYAKHYGFVATAVLRLLLTIYVRLVGR
ncbi:MAG: glycosyltransferase family 2 protein [Chloroflexota bacterium]